MSSSRPSVDRRAGVLRAHEGHRVSPASLVSAVSGAQRPRLVASVAEQLADARDQAFQEGYARGREEARAAAAEEAGRQEVERLQRVREALGAVLDQVAPMRVALVAEAQSAAVSLALELAEAVLERELRDVGAATAEALGRALRLVPQGAPVLVQVHPAAAEQAEALRQMVAAEQVAVVLSADVEPGGCLVQAGPCHIDAQVGPALARARALLEGSVNPVSGRPRAVDSAEGTPEVSG